MGDETWMGESTERGEDRESGTPAVVELEAVESVRDFDRAEQEVANARLE